MTDQALYALSAVTGTMACGLLVASVVSFFRGRAKVAAALSLVALLHASVTLQGLHAAKLSTYGIITPLGTDHVVLLDDPDGTPAGPRLANVDALPIAAGQIDSGTLADARVAESNVTQHEAAIDHDALANFLAAEHHDWTAGTSPFATTSTAQASDVLSVNATDAYVRLLSDSDNNSADQDAQVQFYIDGATVGAATIKGAVGYDQSADVVRMGYGASATDITVDSSNNVGIGQVPGTDKLEVTGDVTATGDITANSFISTAALEASRLVSANNTDGYVDIVGDADNNSADNDSQLRIFTDGRVGVGTQKATLGYDQSIDMVRLSYGDSTTHLGIDSGGDIGIGDSSPDAQLDVQADSTTEVVGLFQMAASHTANPVEVKDSAGTNVFAVDDDGGITVGSGGDKLHEIYTGSATLNFGNLSAGGSETLTITVTGAEVNDVVALGIPNASIGTDLTFMGWVSAADTVSVKAHNHNTMSMEDPASGTFKVTVTDID